MFAQGELTVCCGLGERRNEMRGEAVQVLEASWIMLKARGFGGARTPILRRGRRRPWPLAPWRLGSGFGSLLNPERVLWMTPTRTRWVLDIRLSHRQRRLRPNLWKKRRKVGVTGQAEPPRYGP
jgi:hypothetical protein